MLRCQYSHGLDVFGEREPFLRGRLNQRLPGKHVRVVVEDEPALDLVLMLIHPRRDFVASGFSEARRHVDNRIADELGAALDHPLLQ